MAGHEKACAFDEERKEADVTVEELIQQLNKLPMDAHITVAYDGWQASGELLSVELIKDWIPGDPPHAVLEVK